MPFVEQNFISKTFIIQCIYFLDQYLCTLLRLTTVIKDNNLLKNFKKSMFASVYRISSPRMMDADFIGVT